MDIISGIAVVTETLKLTKELRGTAHELDKAELKLRLVDLIDGLLEAKEALQDAKYREREILGELASLEEKLRDQSSYEDDNGLLYQLDEEEKRLGEPFCNLCYVKEDKKKYRMRYFPSTSSRNSGGFNVPGRAASYRCDNCNTRVIQ